MKTQQRIHGEFSTTRRDPYHGTQEVVLGPRRSVIGQVDGLDSNSLGKVQGDSASVGAIEQPMKRSRKRWSQSEGEWNGMTFNDHDAVTSRQHAESRAT